MHSPATNQRNCSTSNQLPPRPTTTPKFTIVLLVLKKATVQSHCFPATHPHPLHPWIPDRPLRFLRVAMTATTSFSRALSRQLLPGGPRPFTRPHSTLLRVSCNCTSKNARPFSLRHRANLSAAFEHARKYATAVEKKAPAKPKTRAAAPKKRTTTKAKAKKTAAKKPKKKVVKKVKPKVKKVAPEVALRRKERLANSELRAAALLTRPKQLPSTAYLVLVSQISTKGAQLQQIIQSASEKYKTLSPEEREVCSSHVAYLHD